MTLPEKLRILRENNEWTQKEVAEKLDVTESAVQKWETGKNEPPVSELKRIAVLYDSDIDELTDDNREVVNINGLMEVETIPAEVCSMNGDSDHVVFAGGLKYGAMLHRFTNAAGDPYSAIYRSCHEFASCECKSPPGNSQRILVRQDQT